MLCNDDLMSMYEANFTLMHKFKYSLSELNNMLPYEREIYINLLNEHLKEEHERKRRESQKQTQEF